jgi:hypothetical protein
MSLVAILDASVLYPLPLRDTLLRVADIGLYDPRWSEQILQEVAHNLIANQRATDAQAARLLDAMRDAFDEATVPLDAITRLKTAMTNHPKDRHVLAAAVACEAKAVVTLNVRHFPIDACEPFAIEPMHPDAFLLDFYGLDPQQTYQVVERQAAALSRPPMTVDELLDRLATNVPRFAGALRAHQP